MPESKRGFLSLQEAIDKAILFEHESARFYREMKAKAEQQNVLDLLALLEIQKLEHAAALKRIRVRKNLSNPFVQFPPELTLSLPGPLPENPTFTRMLDPAIEREIGSAEIYHSAALEAPAPLYRPDGSWNTVTAGKRSQKEVAALYNFKFVLEDRSRGIHNAK